MNPLQAPVTYQGGKSRLAEQIVKHMAVANDTLFYDLCCGSGAVTLALIGVGHPPDRVVMVEQGPWGLFWRAVSDGTFDLNRFKDRCAEIPTNPREVKEFIERLYRTPISNDGAYTFLLLQAAAVGGAAVSIISGSWKRNSGFRDYWLPTATSSRRSHVNPMMPMPETIVERVSEITQRMRGIQAIHGDARTIVIEPGAVVYIDPPYSGTTGYGTNTINVVEVARTSAERGATVWVSEGRALTADAVCLSSGRAKGGITGDRKRPANEEWLSRFEKAAL